MFFNLLEAALGTSWPERIASLIAFAGIALTIRQLSSSWILDIISSFLYLFVFFKAGFYSDSMLQLVFIGMSVFGWLSWTNQKEGILVEKIRNVKRTELLISACLILAATLTGGYIFSHFVKGAAFPYTDSFCTALSITATWLTARKIIQNWYLWILADLVYVYLFCAKHLFPTALLYGALFILAITGLISWKKIETAGA